MMSEIFAFIQAQFGTHTSQLQKNTSLQDNSPAPQGLFDAFMTEYTAPEDMQNQSVPVTDMNGNIEAQNPMTFSTGKSFTGSVIDILAGKNTEIQTQPDIARSMPEENTKSENAEDWKNLFSDFKRNANNNFRLKRSEISTPGNNFSDFDDGVIVEDLAVNEAETAGIQETINYVPENKNNHSEVNNTAENKNVSEQQVSEQVQEPEILREVPEADKKTDIISRNNNRVEIPELIIDDETHSLEVKSDVKPEFETEKDTETETQPETDESVQVTTLEIKSNDSKQPVINTGKNEIAQTVKPISEPLGGMALKPETETEIINAHSHYADIEDNESSVHLISEINNAVEKLSAALNTLNTDDDTDITQPVKNLISLLTEAIKPETKQKPEITGPEHADNENKTPLIFTEQEADELLSAINDIVDAMNNERSDFKQSAEKLVSIVKEYTAVHRADKIDENIPVSVDNEKENKDAHEIPDTNIVMAGLSGLQPAGQSQSAPKVQEVQEQEQEAEAPNIHPQISRVNQNSARRVHGSSSEISKAEIINDNDSENPETPAISRPFNRSEANQDDFSGRENNQQNQQNQQENSSTPASRSERPEISAPQNRARRISANDTRNERTTQSTGNQRTDAHNDFQSFFDGVLRNRRSSSRIPSQPLNLRTGTYTPSQSSTLREGIVNTVRFIRSDGVHKANIVVDPPALGRISVELTSSTSGVEASVKVASEQIRQIVQEQITQLRENLSQQGVQVSEFTVDVQQDNTGQGQNSGRENQREYYNSLASGNTEDDTEDFRVDLEEGLLYWVA